MIQSERLAGEAGEAEGGLAGGWRGDRPRGGRRGRRRRGGGRRRAHLAGDGAGAAEKAAPESVALGQRTGWLAAGRRRGEAAKEAETSSQGQSAPAEWRLMVSVDSISEPKNSPPRKRGSAPLSPSTTTARTRSYKRGATFWTRKPKKRAQAPGLCEQQFA